MSADEIAYWDAEARDDPRYAAARWGMNGFDDADETIEQILRILDKGMPADDGVIVEIGCGPGRLLTRMADLYGAGDFFGLDISPQMLTLARETIFAGRCWNAHVRYLDEWVPDANFVYCVELFQHLDDDAARTIVDKARRMLLPGGKFIGQFVVAGEPGPHSFPRDPHQIGRMFGSGWSIKTVQRGVHPDWLWLTAVTV